MSVALRLAGFDVRDTLMWLYGSGFPKSLDLRKAIDKQRDDLARTWQGWGTQLKPAYEPVILARRPLDGTVAQNTLTHGCGGLNIDACRVDMNGEIARRTNLGNAQRVSWNAATSENLNTPHEFTSHEQGRWPANILLDAHAAEVLDAQTGTLRTGARAANRYTSAWGTRYGEYRGGVERELHASEGGASRFFYTAKASRAEREAGLQEREARTAAEITGRQEGSRGLVMDGRRNGKTNPYAGTSGQQPRANTHPTVKPLDLMRYLVRLITPKGATVLDPFTGSGSTGCAAVLEGAHFVGVELDPEYAEIARTRIAHYAQQAPAQQEHEARAPETPAPEPHAPTPPAPAPQGHKARARKPSPQLSLF